MHVVCMHDAKLIIRHGLHLTDIWIQSVHKIERGWYALRQSKVLMPTQKVPSHLIYRIFYCILSAQLKRFGVSFITEPTLTYSQANKGPFRITNPMSIRVAN